MFYVIAVARQKVEQPRVPEEHTERWGRIAYIVLSLGFAAHLTFFFTRWSGGGHIPTSNMYEFMTFLAMAIMLAFIVVYAIYRKPLLGLFTLPLTVIIVAYAAVFPQEVQPLIPALQSNWLNIHVTTAALGRSVLRRRFRRRSHVFAADGRFHERTTNKSRREQRWVEFTLYVIIVIVAFVSSVFAFRGAGYEANFTQETVTIDDNGNREFDGQTRSNTRLPPIVKPYNSQVVSVDSFLGMTEPLFERRPG